jgi:hypothetical protein
MYVTTSNLHGDLRNYNDLIFIIVDDDWFRIVVIMLNNNMLSRSSISSLTEPLTN